MVDYEFLKYETYGEGMTKIILNRPPVNAFNPKMRSELMDALGTFGDDEDERIAILMGAGKYFSAGEDLTNINLDADDVQMGIYAFDTLSQYHKIVLKILSSQKPIIAVLNGVAAGAGLSLALACDERFAVSGEKNYLVPAFADMGLIPDGGMTAMLPRFVGKEETQKWFFVSGYKISMEFAVELGIVKFAHDDLSRMMTVIREYSEFLMLKSKESYRRRKAIRNRNLIAELNDTAFPWEIRSQTGRLQSEYFKQKARKFLARKSE